MFAVNCKTLTRHNRQWFSHFNFAGVPKFGALAMEHYLFANRDTLWEKLKWTGKRANPPGYFSSSLVC